VEILRIAVVGAPHSGKTSLIDELKLQLRKDYNVIIAREVPTQLLDQGLNPPHNISGLDFQLECLARYAITYEQIDSFVERSEYFKEKNIIIIYDTTPEIGKAYLSNSRSVEFKDWERQYSLYKRTFDKHKADLTFYCEMLSGEYSSKGNVSRRNIETQKLLSIDEKVEKIYQSDNTYKLDKDSSVEERAFEVINYHIENWFNRKAIESLQVGNTFYINTNPYCGNCGRRANSFQDEYCVACGTKLIKSGTTTFPYPGVITTDRTQHVDPCERCSNNPKNGGSGICLCTLGGPKITY